MEPTSENSSDILKWIFLFAVVLLVGIIVVLLSLKSETKEINIEEENIISLKHGEKVIFDFNGEKHDLKLNYLLENVAYFSLRSNEINFSLKVGEEKVFDLDNKGRYDLQIKLEKVEKERAEIEIKKITSGSQEEVDQIPGESEMNNTQNRSICVENWNCTGWSSCLEGLQSRICTDLNLCGSSNYRPSIVQECVSIPTCSQGDGCKNYCSGGDYDCSCVSQNGKVCLTSESCDGIYLNSSDSSSCCLGNCVLSSPDCSTSCSCALNICFDQNCYNECGQICGGQKQPDCGSRVCGPVPNGCGENCGTCPIGKVCNATWGCGSSTQVVPLTECNPECEIGKECKSGNCVSIKPILSTEWNQRGITAKYAPENPDDEYHWRLGCWSTAFTQILYYYKLLPHGSVSYTPKTGYISENLNSFNFDWSKFVNKVDSSTPTESLNQVAKYSYYTAIVIQKDFSTGSYVIGSGEIRDQLEEHYDVDVVYYPISDYHKNKADTQNIIVTELNAKRPFMLYLSRSDGAHAVVADAYQIVNGELYVHLNMGHGGANNGWVKFFAPIIDGGTNYDGNYRKIFTLKKQ